MKDEAHIFCVMLRVATRSHLILYQLALKCGESARALAAYAFSPD